MSARKNQIRCNILICGGSCGKTSIIKQYTEGTFTEGYMTKENRNPIMKMVEINNNAVELAIYDSCSNLITNEKDHNVFRGKDGFIVIYDVTNYESFANINSCFDCIRQQTDRNTLPVLVGNKIDLKKGRAVSELEAMDVANEQNIPYIETSARDGTNVHELFDLVMANILTPDRDVLERQWSPLNTLSCGCAIS